MSFVYVRVTTTIYQYIYIVVITYINLGGYMKIVKYGVEYRLLDNNGHILIKKNNIIDFNLSVLCNFNINDIVNYEEFYQYYRNT